MTQETVVLSRPDGHTMQASLFLPEASRYPAPAVVVVFDVFGTTPDLNRIAGRFVQQGYGVLIPDLFDRPEPKLLCVLRALRSVARGTGREFDDIEVGRKYLATRSEVDSGKIAIAGFCMGGGFAILLAASGTFKVSAPFYGDVPKDIAALRGACPTIASYGERDRASLINAGQRLKRSLEQLDVPHDIKFYPDAGHGFMNRNTGFIAEKILPNLPVHVGYHHVSAEDAWQRLFSFFDKHLNSSE